MRAIARSLAVEMALHQRAMGRRIAELRERAHLTQEVAADRAGVTLRAYQKWEAGGGIQYSNLARLAEVLGVSVEAVTGQAETPNPFRVGDQLDAITTEFGGRVDEVQASLATIDAKLDQLLALLTADETRPPDLGVAVAADRLAARLPKSPEPDRSPPVQPTPPADGPATGRASRAGTRKAK